MIRLNEHESSRGVGDWRFGPAIFLDIKPENGINIPNGLDGKTKQEIEEED